ncbi:MAG: hypothetical protein QGG48_13225, partial [Desulfatiglandales bacterium]|nr:hypothetical protein [Desulfatiglandales bacterium]
MVKTLTFVFKIFFDKRRFVCRLKQFYAGSPTRSALIMGVVIRGCTNNSPLQGIILKAQTNHAEGLIAFVSLIHIFDGHLHMIDLGGRGALLCLFLSFLLL